MKHGPHKAFIKGGNPFIIVLPQLDLDLVQWYPEQVMAILAQVEATHRVDPTRRYLAGLSLGGYGTWATLAAYPDTFAAAVPICGRGDASTAATVAKTPVWAFHGGKDKGVPPAWSKTMVAAVQTAGGEAKLTIYEEDSHDCWTRAYQQRELYEWLLNHRR